MIDIELQALSLGGRIMMEFRFRARDPGGAFISVWSDVEEVKFIGKPGKPVNVGFLKGVAFLMQYFLT